MKLNNKGITLTEIIISIALIAIVLVFLASLLITVNDINDDSDVNSTYLVNKSLILKNIESDLRETTSLKINTCTYESGKKPANSIYTNYGVGSDYFTNEKGEKLDKLKANFCYEFDYGTTDKAKLGIYYYKKRNSYVISYIYDDIKATKELPDFEKNNVGDDGNFLKQVKTSNDSLINSGNLITGFFTMTIPIIGEDGKDYSIIISYYK